MNSLIYGMIVYLPVYNSELINGYSSTRESVKHDVLVVRINDTSDCVTSNINSYRQTAVIDLRNEGVYRAVCLTLR